MKIRLVAPKTVCRPVVKAIHFPRRTKEAIRQIDDIKIQKRMLRDWAAKPYGHDSLLLKCGHVVTRWRTRPGAMLWRPQECRMCTQREDEMNVRYIRSDLKKKRQATKDRTQRSKVLILKRRK